MVEQRVSIAEADPYLLFGLLGKQVIHPGGRKATEELFALAGLGPGRRVRVGSSPTRASGTPSESLPGR